MPSVAVYWPPRQWEPAVPPPVFEWHPAEPVVIQTASWTCSCASTSWIFNACAIPAPNGGKWDEFQVVVALREVAGAAAVSPDYGLAYASMVQLARLWNAVGLVTETIPNVSWAELVTLAGTYPLQLNGARWFHHSGVRWAAGDELALANPAPSWRSVGQSLDRVEFGIWGSWNALLATGWR